MTAGNDGEETGVTSVGYAAGDRSAMARGSWICAAALALFLGACSNLPRESAASGGSRNDIRLTLVDQARWSMSAHNMQSWEVGLDEADPLAFRVYLAGQRLLPATDPYSRQVVMSIGGFLALVQDSAAARGYRAELSLFPEGDLPGADGGAGYGAPVAAVKLVGRVVAVDPGYLDALSSATVKANLEPLTLGPADAAAFGALNDAPGIRMVFMQDQADLGRLKPVLKQAFRLEMTHEPTLLESYDLTRRNVRQIRAKPWGLSYGSGFPQRSLGSIELFETLFPMKKEKWGPTGADNFDKQIGPAGTFLLIATRGNGRHDQIQAGMLFQRVWLKAIHDGYAILPASQPLQEYPAMAELYRKVHEQLAESGETIQMIAALGVPDDGYRRGFRIRTEDLLRK
jgi:hypothetical protein